MPRDLGQNAYRESLWARYESNISCKAFKTLILIFWKYYLLPDSERQCNVPRFKSEDSFQVPVPLFMSHEIMEKSSFPPSLTLVYAGNEVTTTHPTGLTRALRGYM